MNKSSAVRLALVIVMIGWLGADAVRGESGKGQEPMSRLRSEGGYILDGHGRVVLLPGAAIWVYDASDTGWAIMDSRLEPRPFFWKALRRPYPRFTAGRPLELSYEVEKQEFIYRYQPAAGATMPTEVYLPREIAARSVTVSGGSWSYNEDTEALEVRALPGVSEVVIEAR